MAKQNTTTTDLKGATPIQKAWLKLLTSPKGATRAEMQRAAKTKYPPDAWHLDRLAKRFGFNSYADRAARSDLLVYQFVKPGAKPTAYTATRAAGVQRSSAAKKARR